MSFYDKKKQSNRPFLVITTKFRPGPQAATHVKDWSEQSGWQVEEEVTLVDRIKPRHLAYATLIVDVLEAKVVKNGFQNASGVEAMGHYMQKYREQIKEAIGVWLQREATKAAISGREFVPPDAIKEAIKAMKDAEAVSTEMETVEAKDE